MARRRLILFVLLMSVPAVVLPRLLSAAEDDLRAAKVDGVVITKLQVDNAVTTRGTITQNQRRTALDGIIAQELMAREAVRTKLDQQPKVLEAIESAKRRILSQAYLADRGQGIDKPTPDEIRAYYDKHPALFRDRAIYKLQEIGIRADSTQLAAVLEQYRRVRTLNDMVDWLKANSVPYTTDVAVRAAEDLPSDLLGPVSELKPGQVVKVTTDFGVAIMQLTGKRSEALSFADARAAIARVLANQALGKQIGKDVANWKRGAKIEYFAPFRTSD